MKPKVGEIWYNHFGKFHYLITGDDYAMGMYGDHGYSMLILETGRTDHAFLPHFTAQCYLIR